MSSPGPSEPLIVLRAHHPVQLVVPCSRRPHLHCFPASLERWSHNPSPAPTNQPTGSLVLSFKFEANKISLKAQAPPEVRLGRLPSALSNRTRPVARLSLEPSNALLQSRTGVSKALSQGRGGARRGSPPVVVGTLSHRDQWQFGRNDSRTPPTLKSVLHHSAAEWSRIARSERVAVFKPETDDVTCGYRTNTAIVAMFSSTLKVVARTLSSLGLAPRRHGSGVVARIERLGHDRQRTRVMARVEPLRSAIKANYRTTITAIVRSLRWDDSVDMATLAHFVLTEDAERALANFNQPLLEKSVEYGYLTWPRKAQTRIRDRTVLDVRSGFGGHGSGFLGAGAKHFTGLDPQMDLDVDKAKNELKRVRADFGVTPREIMTLVPDVELLTGKSEDIHHGRAFDCISLYNVTEFCVVDYQPSGA